MVAAKVMVRDLKGKEQAIKWGILRNEKKDLVKIKKGDVINHREYY